MNHHGSITSTSTALVSNLQPELAVVSCGSNNSYGHPNAGPVDRINQAAAARVLLCTTKAPASSLRGGREHHDHDRCAAIARAPRTGASSTSFCDEIAAQHPLRRPADQRVSSASPARDETLGEYVELTNVGRRRSR